MEAQQALALTDQQYPQFLTRLRTLQDTRRRNQQERNQLMDELQRLTNPRAADAGGDEAEIKERLTALQELESRNAAEMRKAYNALDEVLDVRQQARFRVFEEQIERRKLELLMRARQQNRPQSAGVRNQRAGAEASAVRTPRLEWIMRGTNDSLRWRSARDRCRLVSGRAADASTQAAGRRVREEDRRSSSRWPKTNPRKTARDDRSRRTKSTPT